MDIGIQGYRNTGYRVIVSSGLEGRIQGYRYAR